VVAALEGTRSYGVGLARALCAAGLTVVEIEQPRRGDRRKGKSDPIDAHLAALHALRLDASRLPAPRADVDREALRILLGARRELTITKTRQINQLRTLLLTGDDTDRALSRGPLTAAKLTAIARRRGRGEQTREQAVRRAEARRLAVSIPQRRPRLGHQQAATDRPGQRIRAQVAGQDRRRSGVCCWKPSCPGPTLDAAAPTPPSPPWPAPARCRPAAAAPSAIGSTAAVTGRSTARCTTSRLPVGAAVPGPQRYIAKRRAEGKSDNEIRRCLKRYIARELFRTLNASRRT
jgi:transposase